MDTVWWTITIEMKSSRNNNNNDDIYVNVYALQSFYRLKNYIIIVNISIIIIIIWIMKMVIQNAKLFWKVHHVKYIIMF